MFRLRGKGVTTVRGHGTGDLYCAVNVETPVNLTDEQEQMLRSFDDSVEAGGDRHNPRSRSWFDGVKTVFRESRRITRIL